MEGGFVVPRTLDKHVHTLVEACHGLAVSRGWHTDLTTGEPIKRNVGEMLMLTVTELSEGMEGYRKNLKDEHLPNRSSLEVELADAVIRICDIAGALNLDLGGALQEKMDYNAIRSDHSREARLADNGKKV